MSYYFHSFEWPVHKKEEIGPILNDRAEVTGSRQKMMKDDAVGQPRVMNQYQKYHKMVVMNQSANTHFLLYLNSSLHSIPLSLGKKLVLLT